MNYINYHSHSNYSNIITPDVVISNADRTNRSIELGMTTVSYIEHGYCGRFVDGIELAKKHNIKPLLGVETYFVKDRFEKDATNAHLILLAKNENGRKAINRILSEANVTGFYYKARIDLQLVLSLPANDVWVTTACLGGIWKYEDYDELIATFHNHFGNNFFLEVQNHHTDEQKQLNRCILRLSKKHGIQIIAGMDTHMIFESQKVERDNYLLSRGISYPDEQGWFMDFPSYDVTLSRFIEQGVLSQEEAELALANTMIFETVEKYNSIIFDDKVIKMPSIYPDLSQEEKDKAFKKLVRARWEEEKKNISPDKWELYESEIKKEIAVVVQSKMADYFLLDEKIVARGKELGGSITLTGRGSAPSFYIMKLLGITTIDRIAASVKLFPERFITAERILETGSLPDVDLNLGTPEIFAQAQAEVIGQEHSYPMLAYGTVKNSGAWKLYARAAGIDFDTSNLISDILKGFEIDMRHYIEENPDDAEFDNAPQIEDYIDEKYLPIFKESRKYLGIVNTVSPHPCAYLLFDHGNIREEFGLIKIKSGNSEHICANCDGLFAEKYKMLKNDLLKVSVVDLIYRVFKRIGIEPFSLSKLLQIADDQTWDIYKKALGMGINQVERSGTIERVAKFAPRNISDLSAFVAAIRPGFKSNYAQFEARLPFEYGVKSLDAVIQTEEFPFSYMLYQENAMNVMAWAGIPIKQTYEIIKNIAKKRYEKVLAYKEKFLEGMLTRLLSTEKLEKEKAVEIAKMTWQIIEDSSRYSFNASHSYSVAGDSVYGAWLKAHYPVEFYEVFLQMMEEDGNKDRLNLAKREAETAFGIHFPKIKFGQDNRKITGNPERKEITQSIKSMKGFGLKISEDVYALSKIFNGETFVDLLVCAEENGFLSSKFEQLIKIGYFDDFGGEKKLLSIFSEFRSGKFRYNKGLTSKNKEKRLKELKSIELYTDDKCFSIQEKLACEFEIAGSISSRFDVHPRYSFVTDLNLDFAPKITIHTLKNGLEKTFKISKAVFHEHPFKIGDIIKCHSYKKRFAKRRNADGGYDDIPDRYDLWLETYYVMKPTDQFLSDEETK